MRQVLVALALTSSPSLVGGFVGRPALCPTRAPRSAADVCVVMLAKKKKGGEKGARKSGVPAAAAVAEVATAPAPAPAAAVEDVGEIFPLPAGLWERRRIAAADASFEAVLAAAGATADDEQLAEFVQTNRDMLDYRWLYRLTGELLRAQNTGDEARSVELQELRARVIKLNQRYDAPLFKQIAEAEGRLGQVLGLYAANQVPPPSEVIKAAGQTSTQVFAFWVVVCAAVAAWEAKLSVPSVVAQAKAKLAELEEVLGALEAQPQLLKLASLDQLHPLLAQPNQALPAATPSEARASLEAMGLDADEQQQLIRKLGCLSCQASRHAFQAYNPFVQKSAALYDVLLYGRIRPLAAPDIQSPTRTEYTSNLVKLAVEADGMAVSENNPVQLFW